MRRSLIRRTSVGLAGMALGVALGTSAPPAQGEPLTEEACTAIKTERAQLESRGVGEDLRRGPVAVGKSLPRERLVEIERLIHLIEQVEFRCPRPPPPKPPVEAAAKLPEVKSGAGAETGASKAPDGSPKAATGKPERQPAKQAPAPQRKPPAAARATATPAAATAPEKKGLEQ